MNAAVIGWGLAVVGIALGYVQYGWPGVLLVLTVVVFWLLLQFSRATRALRAAASRPIGKVPSAVTLNSKLRSGLPLTQILVLTGSLGERVGEAEGSTERFAWHDESGAKVTVTLVGGRLTQWQLDRTDA
jgi:hypothetical protein